MNSIYKITLENCQGEEYFVYYKSTSIHALCHLLERDNFCAGDVLSIKRVKRVSNDLMPYVRS